MKQIKTKWHGAALSALALVILGVVMTQGSTRIAVNTTFDPILESAKWATRFLLLSLAMTPLNTYFGWRWALRFRKPAGLWAFAFAVLHVVLLLADGGIGWLIPLPPPPFVIVGLVGLAILTALAATSTQAAMKRLGKNWKRLHRLVYVAGGAVVLHALLATAASKRIFTRDPDAIYELTVYAVILVILLLARVPFVRAALHSLRSRLLARHPVES